MSGKQMVKLFKNLFPGKAEHVYKWVDNGKKQITLYFDDRTSATFTVNKNKYVLEGML